MFVVRQTEPDALGGEREAADHQRNTVLAAVTGTNTIAVVDARRGTVVQTVPVAAGPAGMAITPDGRVLVGNQEAGVVTELTPRRHG